MKGTLFITLIVVAVAIMMLAGCASNITTMREGETSIKQISLSTIFASQEEGAGSVAYTWLEDGSGDLAVNGSALGQSGKLTQEEAAVLGAVFMKILGSTAIPP